MGSKMEKTSVRRDQPGTILPTPCSAGRWLAGIQNAVPELLTAMIALSGTSFADRDVSMTNPRGKRSGHTYHAARIRFCMPHNGSESLVEFKRHGRIHGDWTEILVCRVGQAAAIEPGNGGHTKWGLATTKNGTGRVCSACPLLFLCFRFIAPDNRREQRLQHLSSG